MWALSTDKESEAAIDNLQMKIDLTLLDQEYQKLFGPNGNVPTAISSYDMDVQRFVDFRHVRNVPEAENVDHFRLVIAYGFLVRRQHGIAICSTGFIR